MEPVVAESSWMKAAMVGLAILEPMLDGMALAETALMAELALDGVLAGPLFVSVQVELRWG